jgi:hypothetical protein
MITAKSLTNIRIGTDAGYKVSIRFKAKYTGAIVSFRSYWILENPNPGYAHGWRGNYTHDFCLDASGVPGPRFTGGSRSPDPAYTEYPNNGAFPLILFAGARVVEGQWYHIVITNVDPDPINNYASLDVLWDPTATSQIPDMQILLASNAAPWASQLSDIPSPMAIFYADGNVQGCSYYQLAPNGSLMSGEEYGFPASLKL